MTIIISSVIFAALLLIITKVPVGLAQVKQGGGYDYNLPRVQQAKLEGFGQRALGCHQNSIEAFPYFAAGVALALISGASLETAQWLCGIFVVSRIGYCLCYWMDIALMRSTFWFFGFGSSIGLMVLALP